MSAAAQPRRCAEREPSVVALPGGRCLHCAGDEPLVVFDECLHASVCAECAAEAWNKCPICHHTSERVHRYAAP